MRNKTVLACSGRTSLFRLLPGVVVGGLLAASCGDTADNGDVTTPVGSTGAPTATAAMTTGGPTPSSPSASAAPSLSATGVPSASATGAPSASVTGTPSAEPSGMPSAMPSASTPVPTTIPAFFTSSACFACHGLMGQGAGAAGPDLLHPVEGYTQWIIRNGRGTMPAFTELQVTDADIAELMAYLSAQPRPTTGEGLYVDLCSTCHGNEEGNLAMGGTWGNKAPAVKGKDAATITMFVRNGHDGMNYGSDTYMPAWTAAELSDTELQAIITFLQ